MSRIRYGIKNVYYATATSDSSGNLTYATPVAVPGAKSISLDAQGEDVDEYADNAVWYQTVTNNGYSGTLEFEDTATADTFIQTVLSNVKDSTTGRVTEKASDVPKEFALGFQFELAGGTETGKRVWLVRCTASRPSISGQTKESSIAVQTNTVNIKAVPRIADDVVKYSCVSTDPDYTNWFSAVEQATT